MGVDAAREDLVLVLAHRHAEDVGAVLVVVKGLGQRAGAPVLDLDVPEGVP